MGDGRSLLVHAQSSPTAAVPSQIANVADVGTYVLRAWVPLASALASAAREPWALLVLVVLGPEQALQALALEQRREPLSAGVRRVSKEGQRA